MKTALVADCAERPAVGISTISNCGENRMVASRALRGHILKIRSTRRNVTRGPIRFSTCEAGVPCRGPGCGAPAFWRLRVVVLAR
jgi:hypothetical protein